MTLGLAFPERTNFTFRAYSICLSDLSAHVSGVKCPILFDAESSRDLFRRLRGMSYAERRSHVVQIWQNTKKGEYDVVKHLKYNNISICFYYAYESAIISFFYQ